MRFWRRLARLADPAPTAAEIIDEGYELSLAEFLPGELDEIEAISSPPAELGLTDFARRQLAQLDEGAGASIASRANGRILADLLRGGSPHSDVAIAGYLLALLDYMTRGYFTAGQDPAAAWHWIVTTLAAAALELTEIDRLGGADELLPDVS